jgi:hypothetical protein
LVEDHRDLGCEGDGDGVCDGVGGGGYLSEEGSERKKERKGKEEGVGWVGRTRAEPRMVMPDSAWNRPE